MSLAWCEVGCAGFWQGPIATRDIGSVKYVIGVRGEGGDGFRSVTNDGVTDDSVCQFLERCTGSVCACQRRWWVCPFGS